METWARVTVPLNHGVSGALEEPDGGEGSGSDKADAAAIAKGRPSSCILLPRDSTSGMQGTSQAAGSGRVGPRLGSSLVVGAVLLLLWRASRLLWSYRDKLSGLHTPDVLVLAATGTLLVFGLLLVGLSRRPRLAVLAWVVLAAAMTLLSGNAGAMGVAVVLLAVTIVVGDLVSRLLRGVEAEQGDLVSVFSAGLVAVGLIVLMLGEAGVLSGGALGAALGVVVVARMRRLRPLARLLRGSCRLPSGGAPAWVEAAWLSFAALVLLALWAGALSPDVSWDGLAYHLPEARDIARLGRVAVRPDLVPHSLLWRNHDAYLSLGFFYGGERIVRLLQFAVGLAVFGAALALARRLRLRDSGALIVFALAAFPPAMLQLRATYVDWPAALLVTAAAAELAAGRVGGGRLRLSGFLFGGALVTKVFAVCALPALLILLVRARPRATPKSLAAALACALVALGPWLAWSARHAESIAAPYAASPAELLARVTSGHYFRTSPASGVSAPPRAAGVRLRALALLPYDLVFHSSRFEANGDGYNGILVLVLLVGLAGWDARHVGLFCAAALAFLVPWSLLYLPSIRYLFPVYPLYAVFCAEGLRRLTGRFAGRSGAAAGIALVVAAAAFPVQFGSSGLEWGVAAGRVSREQSLAARLPGYRLWSNVSARDRVVLFGENDRFHCPAELAWSEEYLPVAAWGRDPAAWRAGLDELGITQLVYRSDRRREGLLGALGDRLQLVGRDGPAALYRVR